MKQLKTIEKAKQIFPTVEGIEVALLYGSFGRNEANPNSDIDIQILVNEHFNAQNLVDIFKAEFNAIRFISEINLRNKVVVYFDAQPKMELGICYNLADIDRNYLGSEIEKVEETVLFATDQWQGKIESYLRGIVANRNAYKMPHNRQIMAMELVDKFIYEFENCSTMHRRSDGFQSYFFYNIALHLAVQLNHLSKGEIKYNFLPKNFVSKTLKSHEQNLFYDLKGTLFLPEANQQKRRLLDFFYSSVETLVSKEKLEELKEILEWIYERDYLWNFRDICTNNPIIKSGIVFRTSTLTLYQDEPFFENLLSEKQIKTVVDLRADREIKELPYFDKTLALIQYVNAPFDPWNQSIEFQATHHHGSNIEIAYRFFGIECKSSIATTIEAILNENDATAIHCHAGKDRTGIIVTLLHLLSGAELDIIYNDYLATEMDTRKEYLDIILDIITVKGGIEAYLIDCGVQQIQIEKLKYKLLNGN